MNIGVGLGGAVGSCVDVDNTIGVATATGVVGEVQLTDAMVNVIPHKSGNFLL